MKRVLVLDANQRSSLAVVRSLGVQGVPLITADDTPDALTGNSRYSLRYFSYPSPQLNPDACFSAIEQLCKKENISVIIPLTELTAALLLENKSSLIDISLPFAELNTINTLADKCSLMRLAKSIGIPTPATWQAENPDDLPVDLDALTYPVILKPGRSWLKHKGAWLHTTVRIANNAADATTILQTDPAYLAHPFMIQEFIPGKGCGIFALYDQGKPLAFFAHQRLREKPPRGGVSVLSESVALDSTLESYARQLLDHVSWHGVAMVEFRITPDGTPYLMEINTRFWGSLQLAVNAGVNFPWLLYQITCNKKVATVKHYKTGVRLHWLFGNLDWLYLILRDRQFTIKNKIMAIASFLKPSPFKTRFEVLRWNDMSPFWWELKQYIKDILKQ